MTNVLYQLAEGACIPAHLAGPLGDLLDQAAAADTQSEAADQAADLAAQAAAEAAAEAAVLGLAKRSADKALAAFLRNNGLTRRAEGIMTMDEAEDRAAGRRTFGCDLAGGSYTRSDVI